MNNARQTVNIKLQTVVAGLSGGLTFYTGDEADPTVNPPAVSVLWLSGDGYSTITPDQRIGLVQIDVLTPRQDTAGAEASCEAILSALGIQKGAKPLGTLPMQSWTADASGNPIGTLTGSTITIRPQLGKGWKRLDPPQQRARRYTITLEVHYLP